MLGRRWTQAALPHNENFTPAIKVAERATQEEQRSKQEGNGAATIKSLGRPLNGPAFNGDSYVAPDESYRIVSPRETKDGESELFISFRKSGHAILCIVGVCVEHGAICAGVAAAVVDQVPIRG